MIQGLGMMASALLAFAGAALGVALLAAVLLPAVQRAIRPLPPHTQAGLLLALACAPALAGLYLLSAALMPSLAHILGLAVDHCQDHGHHAHFCPIHSPLWTGGVLERLILIAAGVSILALLGGLAVRLRRVARVVRLLEMARLPVLGDGPYRAVESAGPVALTAGLLRPRVYLSCGLVDALSPVELDAVVAHEQAHRRRRDPLRLLVADVLSRLHLPPIRRRLLRELILATERACDERAALTCGDRCGAAAAILKVARLNRARPAPSDALLPAVTGADLAGRVEALLRPAHPVRGRQGLIVALGIALILTLGWVHSDWLHHAVESAFHLMMD